jgi:hypothetical protein
MDKAQDQAGGRLSGISLSSHAMKFFEKRADKFSKANVNVLVKSLLGRHPGESRGPGLPEKTGFRLSPE